MFFFKNKKKADKAEKDAKIVIQISDLVKRVLPVDIECGDELICSEQDIYYGIAAGDIKANNMERFGDNTILAMAMMDAAKSIIINDLESNLPIRTELAKHIRNYVNAYPDAGYDQSILKMAGKEEDRTSSERSFGAVARAAVFACMMDDIEFAATCAANSAAVAKCRPEAVQEMAIVASLCFLAAHGASKDDLIKYIQQVYPKTGLEKKKTKPMLSKPIIVQAAYCINHTSNMDECIQLAEGFKNNKADLYSVLGILTRIIFKEEMVSDAELKEKFKIQDVHADNQEKLNSFLKAI